MAPFSIKIRDLIHNNPKAILLKYKFDETMTIYSVKRILALENQEFRNIEFENIEIMCGISTLSSKDDEKTLGELDITSDSIFIVRMKKNQEPPPVHRDVIDVRQDVIDDDEMNLREDEPLIQEHAPAPIPVPVPVPVPIPPVQHVPVPIPMIIHGNAVDPNGDVIATPEQRRTINTIAGRLNNLDSYKLLLLSLNMTQADMLYNVFIQCKEQFPNNPLITDELVFSVIVASALKNREPTETIYNNIINGGQYVTDKTQPVPASFYNGLFKLTTSKMFERVGAGVGAGAGAGAGVGTGAGGEYQQQPILPQIPGQFAYQEQLDRIFGMGFADVEHIKQLLTRARGNMEQTLNQLMGN